VYACWNFLPEAICFEGQMPVQDGNSLWG